MQPSRAVSTLQVGLTDLYLPGQAQCLIPVGVSHELLLECISSSSCFVPVAARKNPQVQKGGFRVVAES